MEAGSFSRVSWVLFKWAGYFYERNSKIRVTFVGRILERDHVWDFGKALGQKSRFVWRDSLRPLYKMTPPK